MGNSTYALERENRSARILPRALCDVLGRLGSCGGACDSGREAGILHAFTLEHLLA